jgi:DNA-binding HTH domain-containing proteins
MEGLRCELRVICDEVLARGAGLVLDIARGDEPKPITVGLPAELVEDYRYRYASCCPLSRILAGLHPGRFHALDTLHDPAFARLDDMQHGFLKPYGIRHIAIGNWQLRGGASVNCGFQRGASDAPFAPDELALLERRIDSLTSVKLGSLVASEPLVDSALRTVFDFAVTPMLLLTAKGDLLRANRSASKLVRSGSVLTVHGGVLQGVESDTRVRLANTLGALAPDDKSCVLRLAGRSGAWIAALRPIDVRLPGNDPGRQRFVLMQLSSPSSPVGVANMGILGRLFGLTSAEEAVAWEIFAGHSVESAALAHNKGIATVKTQLNNAMHKLGVARQAEMVKWLASLALLPM